jgi:hypothetical protein
MAAESVVLERLPDRVRQVAAVFRDGEQVGELEWSLTDDRVLRIEWSGEALRGFEAWSTQ